MQQILNIINIRAMKKLILLALLAVGMTANAEEKDGNDVMSGADTALFTVDDDDDVSVKNNMDVINLGDGKDEDDHWSMHLYVGGILPTNVPDKMKFSDRYCMEFNWTVVQYDYQPKNSKFTLSAGLGFNWRKYELYGHKEMFTKVGDVVTVVPAGANMDDLWSDIHTTSLSMPLLVKYSFSKDFAISLGGQLNWNYYARIQTSYEHGDDYTDIYTKDIGQRPFTVDIMGIVHLWGMGIYCKYSPMSVLKSGRGPEFKSVTIGIRI